MSKKHLKHAKITKPDLGVFARTEFSILGTPCSEIKQLAQIICSALSPHYQIAYADADHQSADDSSNLEGSILATGSSMEYVDKIDFHRFDQKTTLNPWRYKTHFRDLDLVIINGNHFESNRQILVIDPRKSLEKKLHKLTQVQLVLFLNEEKVIPDYLQEHIPGIEKIPQFKISETEKIIHWVRQLLTHAIAPIHGLVLAGGKSERMGQNKALIDYHGKSQKAHMYDLLSACTSQAFYSVRENPEDTSEIADTFTGLGPYGAILSAFRSNPNVAWLVTACDQPFLTQEVIQKLISDRNPSKVATAFYNPETDFPEPLITIWEPRAYAYLLDFLSQGYSCPRKVLINTDIELIKLDDTSVLRNVNTPEEYRAARQELD
ncbi:NTP transferase domain-containing protein [Reichenbachiella agarivorans]|uniref:Probable molybdenum cofactor guanylyltransferase n=1 Tax=Reichenbachiella agarivorans TaxID=2979464 RepID=A0ABY6CPM4_9BACT|nr:NTP transferase domain-containing protein [Reichenbachiella agarivorans]UXP32465.1 NTP transferase domain-containing protein [Reichenbachiella agarivorans]